MKKEDLAGIDYLDPPHSVESVVLALSMGVAATAVDCAKKLKIDLGSITIKLDVGQQSIRFRLQGRKVS